MQLGDSDGVASAAGSLYGTCTLRPMNMRSQQSKEEGQGEGEEEKVAKV